MLSTASADDYFKEGRWQKEQMILDTEILEAHRKEAGAPEPVPIEEVELPPLPRGATGPGAARPTFAGSAPEAGSAQNDLRQIELFVAKYRLEPTRTKILLARLKPERRRWVMQSFRGGNGSTTPTKSLEDFITRAEKTNNWEASSKPAPVGASPGAKRPLSPGSAPPVKVARTGSAKAKPTPMLRPTPKSSGGKPSPPARPSGAPPPSATKPPATPSTAKVDAVDRPGDLIRNLLGSR